MNSDDKLWKRLRSNMGPALDDDDGDVDDDWSTDIITSPDRDVPFLAAQRSGISVCPSVRPSV